MGIGFEFIIIIILPDAVEYNFSDDGFSKNKLKATLKKYLFNTQSLTKTEKTTFLDELMAQIVAIWPGPKVVFDK